MCGKRLSCPHHVVQLGNTQWQFVCGKFALVVVVSRAQCDSVCKLTFRLTTARTLNNCGHQQARKRAKTRDKTDPETESEADSGETERDHRAKFNILTPHKYYAQQSAKLLHHRSHHLALNTLTERRHSWPWTQTERHARGVHTCLAIGQAPDQVGRCTARLNPNHQYTPQVTDFSPIGGRKTCQLKVSPLQKERFLPHDLPLKHGRHSVFHQ